MAKRMVPDEYVFQKLDEISSVDFLLFRVCIPLIVEQDIIAKV